MKSLIDLTLLLKKGDRIFVNGVDYGITHKNRVFLILKGDFFEYI